MALISGSEESKWNEEDFNKMEYLNNLDSEPIDDLDAELAEDPCFENRSSMKQRLADVMHQSV